MGPGLATAQPGATALPPGPDGGRLGPTVALHRDPQDTLERARRRYGDVFTTRLTTIGRVVVVATPDAPEVLGYGDPSVAHAGAARRGVLPQADPRSLFGSDGAVHHAARARIAPAFTPEAIAAHGPAITSIAERHVAALPDGRPVRLLPRMRALADEVFVRCLLGVTDGDRVTALVRAIGGLLWTPGNPPVSIPGPDDGLAGRALDKEFARRREQVAVPLRAELAERRRAAARDDLLGLLVAAEPEQSDDALIDELLAVAMAGQEPAASALTWVALTLAHVPEVADRIAGHPADRILGHAVDEALRLHPPALAMLRTLTAPVDIGGHHLPAGTRTMVPIGLLHRDARAVSDPDRFRPDRWAGPDAPRLWAFGAGARQCIAQPLARAELAVAIPVLLQRRRLRPAWPRMERAVLRGTIQVPHRSGLVVAGPRAR